jgi:hypothetical protein
MRRRYHRKPSGNQHSYRCPSCVRSDDIAVQAMIWTALSRQGSDPDGRTPSHDHGWDADHLAACTACGWQGTVRELGGADASSARRQVHLVVVHGDEEIRSVRVFSLEESATSYRNELVRSQWQDCMSEPMPVDPEEAFAQFCEVVMDDGVFIHLESTEVEV